MTLSERIAKAQREAKQADRKAEAAKAEARIRNVSTEEAVNLLKADVRR